MLSLKIIMFLTSEDCKIHPKSINLLHLSLPQISAQ